jgi:chemotaxis methyl-accepting protein methylase
LALKDAHSAPAASPEVESIALQAILALLGRRTGIDFGSYRGSTIGRRVQNRMISVGARSHEEYLALLREDEDEAGRLLQRVTIKVSRFYRDRSTFDSLRSVVLPELAERQGRAALTLWSAGCGFGEEPYTLAMLLDEAGIAGSVLATDVDPAALAHAVAARYPASALAELPVELRERYCRHADDHYSIDAALRPRVRFARHDLTATGSLPEPGSFDLICCRNVLIYFERGPQQAAMHRLCRALRPGGYLCLGEAEWPLPSLAGMLESLPPRTRLFRIADAAMRSAS